MKVTIITPDNDILELKEKICRALGKGISLTFEKDGEMVYPQLIVGRARNCGEVEILKKMLQKEICFSNIEPKIELLKEPNKWEKIENPPKSDQYEYVLTYGKKCGYGVEYVPLAEIMGFSLNITHWMPLSLQPPKGE